MGNTDIAQWLLKEGADVNAQGAEYGTALQAASQMGHAEIVQLLLAEGADVNMQGGYFGNALQRALHKGHKQIVELLLGKGADSNAQSQGYDTALWPALGVGHSQVAPQVVGQRINLVLVRHGESVSASKNCFSLPPSSSDGVGGDDDTLTLKGILRCEKLGQELLARKDASAF